MSKDRQSDDDTTGVAGLTKIARGLSDLFNVLAEFEQLPRRGRHEKDGRVMEYSFNTRTLREAAGERSEHKEEPERAQTPRHRAPKPSSLDLLEPVTDVFDEAGEVVIFFELPGVERKDVRCFLDGDILLLEARAGDRLYRKEMLIEEKLAGGAPQTSLHNGILEVRLGKQK
ncbi:Hsp20/alpha crystallin family protein [Bradyrhizobium liaoningense]